MRVNPRNPSYKHQGAYRLTVCAGRNNRNSTGGVGVGSRVGIGVLLGKDPVI